MKQFILIFALALTASLGLQAQPMLNASYSTYIRTAEEQLELKQYYNALDSYMEAYLLRKDYDLAIQIGDLSYKLRDYKKAVSYYKRAIRKDTKDEKGAYTEFLFPYGRSQKMMGMYDEAIVTLQRYIDEGADETLKELAKAEIQGAEFAKLAQPIENLTVTNAGRKVNTKTSEYSPTLADGGNTMYYSGFGTDEIIVLDGKAERTNAMVMSSKRGEKGWEEPTELDEIINRAGYHTSNVNVTADGERMFLSRMMLDGVVITESKIYVSNKTSDGWGPVKELVGVNGEYNAKHAVFGELFGNEVVFFISDMEGGEGGDDLYYATRKSGEVYGDPVNLGPKVNTPGDEATPYYRDGNLFFSSNGHPTMGGFDIFTTVWDGARWSSPENMGMGYNTPLDEKYFTLDAEGYQGTLTSNRAGTRSLKSKTCCDDIYYVNLKKILADLIVTSFDTKEKQPLTGVSLQLIEMTDNTEGVTQSQSNADGNEFKFDLDLDKAYRIIAQAENYVSDTVEFNTVGMIDSRTYAEMVNLMPLPKYDTIVTEQPIELGNVLYDLNKADIRPDAEPDLTFLLNLMNEYPTMIIELSSHTDSRGTDADNKALSVRRAESARRWLMAKGIARRRIQAVGYGESNPRKVSDKIASAYTFLPEGTVLTEEYINAMQGEEVQELAHQLNRRTEFKILSGPTSIRIEETKLLQIGNKKVQEQSQSAPDKGANIIEQHDPPTKVSKKSSLYGRKDLSGVPIMTFKTRMIELGKVKKGEKRTGTFYFTNEGDTELYIDLIDACSCTTVVWPEGKTFKHGEGGQIDFTFDSTEKDESETIDLNILLSQATPGDDMPIVEEVNYSFELAK
ncbi:MAG: peptidoglycan-associated lipoprotein [Saprospiraceae bacterium]|jgi:peptidoglycan-associated lipoprotein